MNLTFETVCLSEKCQRLNYLEILANKWKKRCNTIQSCRVLLFLPDFLSISFFADAGESQLSMFVWLISQIFYFQLN